MNAPDVPADYLNPMRIKDGGDLVDVVPSGCAMHALTPQEEALEFMLIDLSSCLLPIGGTAPAQPPIK